MELQRFAANAEPEEIIEAIRIDGGAILLDVLDPATVERLNTELDPWVTSTPNGKDDFGGRNTTRTGALVSRSEGCRDLVMNGIVLDLANRFLAPYTNRLQLHLTQVITIKPDQGSQPLHRDRAAWGGYIPKEIEPQFNTMWALTDFTEQNGATRIVPGSPSWDDDRRANDDEKVQATMSAGSVLLYSGSVIHGGGENQTDRERRGINITYTTSWLRTEENHYLSCPPEVAKELDPELQELLGYTMGNYALGYYSNPEEVASNSDILPPEYALGRRPREKIAITTLS